MKHFSLLFALLVSPILFAQDTIILCGHLFDADKGTFRDRVSVHIEGERITKVVDGYTAEYPSTTKVIDLKDHWVLPGLIDMHVHIESELGKGSYIKRFTLNDADVAYDAAHYAKLTLMAGFTSVRDLGGTGVNLALRDAINQGKTTGPRLFTAGKAIAITGGHADPTNGFKDELLCHPPGPHEGVCDGRDECMKAVRQRSKDGVDWIKITATAGVLSLNADSSGPQFTEEEVIAIVKTAADRGLKVAAHAHGVEGMQRAIRGGVTTIEHGSFMDDETMSLMKRYGTYLVPTITAGISVMDSAKIEGYFPRLVTPKALEVGPLIQNTFGRAYKAGVKIAFGTDAGVFPHGKNAKEFALMCEAGMPESEALQAATITNAIVLDEAENIGSIVAGKYADIIAVKSNPLDDITVLENVPFVMKSGVVYKTN